MSPHPRLPEGVELRPLTLNGDERGTFVEIFRDEWNLPVEPVQWNAVRSAAGTLRGAHVHVAHHDCLTVVDGRATVGLRDIRPESPTDGLVATVELDGDAPSALAIPVGVVHGFYFPVESLHIYGVSAYWSPDDEFACRWDDPELAIPWGGVPRLLSERDRDAASFAAMRDAYRVRSGEPALR